MTLFAYRGTGASLLVLVQGVAAFYIWTLMNISTFISNPQKPETKEEFPLQHLLVTGKAPLLKCQKFQREGQNVLLLISLRTSL